MSKEGGRERGSEAEVEEEEEGEDWPLPCLRRISWTRRSRRLWEKRRGGKEGRGEKK